MPIQKALFPEEKTTTMFDLSNKICNIIGEVIENDGVITDVQIKALDELKGDFKEKAQAICHVRMRTENDIDYWKGVKAAAEAKIKSLNARKERLERYLLENMKAVNMEKISGDRYMFSISVSKGRESVVVDNVDILPEGYFKKQADKTKIKEAILAGRTITGASIEKGADYLSIRSNTKFNIMEDGTTVKY